MPTIVDQYLDLLDAQRETAFAALERRDEVWLWQRPARRAWCPGEIVDHNTRLIASTMPMLKFAWQTQHRRAEKRRARPYATHIADPYHKASFPHWVGFLWTPRHNPKHPVPLAVLQHESRALHAAVRAFYSGKDPALLGNVILYDPLIGAFNLIETLLIGIYHDQLHFDDLLRMAQIQASHDG